MAADRILLLGLMGRYPMAGVGWQALHYIVGLERLGFDVFYAEDSAAPPYDPRRVELARDAAANVGFVQATMARTAHPESWAYYDALDDRWHGRGREAVQEWYATSRQVWNLCGASRLPAVRAGPARRVYVQTDPGYEQIALQNGDDDIAAKIDAHDVLFTYGENLAAGVAALPAVGRTWHPTRPPVLLDQWAAASAAPDAPFSTVGSWRNRGKDVVWRGEAHVWSKHEGFEAILDVPRRAGVRMVAALRPPPDVAARMGGAGWRLRDPWEVSSDLDTYRDFVRASCGELTVAKDVYVRSRSGWFSDRSACYLASGRPVVTEDTGIEHGSGVATYRTGDEAVAALRSLPEEPGVRARVARDSAERFEASRVLGAMLEVIA